MNDFFDFEEAWFKKAKHLKLDEKTINAQLDAIVEEDSSYRDWVEQVREKLTKSKLLLEEGDLS